MPITGDVQGSPYAQAKLERFLRTGSMYDTAEQADLEQSQKQEADRQSLANFFDPQHQAMRQEQQQFELAKVGEPQRVQQAGALEVEKQKAQAERDVAATKAAGGGPKYNAQEQQMIDSAQGINALGRPLLQKFESRYPGIGSNPQQYGSPISDTLTEKLGKGIYSFGGMTDRDELLQDSAAIQAWGVRALSQGRINKQMMDMISAHLPQPGYSPGANYDRLRRLVTDILPSQLQGIQEGHGQAPLTLGTGGPSVAAPADPLGIR